MGVLIRQVPAQERDNNSLTRSAAQVIVAARSGSEWSGEQRLTWAFYLGLLPLPGQLIEESLIPSHMYFFFFYYHLSCPYFFSICVSVYLFFC